MQRAPLAVKTKIPMHVHDMEPGLCHPLEKNKTKATKTLHFTRLPSTKKEKKKIPGSKRSTVHTTM